MHSKAGVYRKSHNLYIVYNEGMWTHTEFDIVIVIGMFMLIRVLLDYLDF